MKSKIISSYHNHNYLCGHAIGEVKDYCLRALELGYEEIGISDHGPLPFEFAGARMNYERFLDLYLPQFEEARKLVKDQISIRVGLELEYIEGYDDYYKALLQEVDYFILGEHVFLYQNTLVNPYVDQMDDFMVKVYVDNCIKALETGLFKIIAHPDIVFYNVYEISEESLEEIERLIIKAKELDVYVEYNANGYRNSSLPGTNLKRYPRKEVLALMIKHQVKVIVGEDAHNFDCLSDECSLQSYEILENEKANLVYKLDF